MTERMIIGLYSSVPQSGKSTSASVLTQEYNFQCRSFATALKRMVCDLLYSAGLSPEQVGHYMTAGKEDPIPEVGGRSFRQLTQTLGTDWGRMLVHKNLWVDLLVKNTKDTPLLVIDDVRFENEFDAIRAEGGQIWRIIVPGKQATNDHPSEGLLDHKEFDEVIVNDGDLEALRAKVRKALV